MLESSDFSKGQGQFGFLVVMVVKRRVQGLVDETALAASADSTHTGERAEWDFDRYIFEIMSSGSCKSNAFAVAFSSFFWYFNLAFTI